MLETQMVPVLTYAAMRQAEQASHAPRSLQA